MGALFGVCYRDIQNLGGIRFPERDEIYEIALNGKKRKLSVKERLHEALLEIENLKREISKKEDTTPTVPG